MGATTLVAPAPLHNNKQLNKKQYNNKQFKNRIIFKMTKKEFNQKMKETQVRMYEIISQISTKEKKGGECFCCGTINPNVLAKHHLDWEIKNGKPKSDKSSETVTLCFNCHKLIHNQILMGINYNDNEILAEINALEDFVGKGEVDKEIGYFLEKVFIGRYEPKSPMENLALSCWATN